MDLFHFELCEQLQEPLKRPLLTVDPDEVDLLQLEIGRLLKPLGPLVVARGAHRLGLPVFEHQGLQDGGERRDANAGGDLKSDVKKRFLSSGRIIYQNGVLRIKDGARRRPVRPVDEDLERRPLLRVSSDRPGHGPSHALCQVLAVVC